MTRPRRHRPALRRDGRPRRQAAGTTDTRSRLGDGGFEKYDQISEVGNAEADLVDLIARILVEQDLSKGGATKP